MTTVTAAPTTDNTSSGSGATVTQVPGTTTTVAYKTTATVTVIAASTTDNTSSGSGATVAYTSGTTTTFNTTASVSALNPAHTNTVVTSSKTTSGSNTHSSTQNTTFMAKTASSSLGNFSSTTPVPTCSEPKAIIGGAIISTGPYFGNITSVVYTCFTGYSINGPASMLCSPTGTWDLDPPQCVPVDNHPHVNNNISVEDKNGVPMWLIIVMCVTFGLLCLLLLTCVLVYCLKMFGCLTKEGARCNCCGNRVADTERGRHHSIMFGDIDKHAYVTPTPVYPENPENPPSNPRRKTSHISVKPVRKEAKIPEKLWMPHSNNVRVINTSTK